jgi:hypothetical protein
MGVTKTLEQTAGELATAHAKSEEDTLEIYLAPDKGEIRLVEVSETVGTTNEVLPFQFDPQPAKGIFFPLSVVVVSPEEMKRILNGELNLPEGWGTPDRLRRIFRKGE